MTAWKKTWSQTSFHCRPAGTLTDLSSQSRFLLLKHICQDGVPLFQSHNDADFSAEGTKRFIGRHRHSRSQSNVFSIWSYLSWCRWNYWKWSFRPHGNSCQHRCRTGSNLLVAYRRICVFLLLHIICWAVMSAANRRFIISVCICSFRRTSRMHRCKSPIENNDDVTWKNGFSSSNFDLFDHHFIFFLMIRHGV